jgi:hypothetical protein
MISPVSQAVEGNLTPVLPARDALSEASRQP